MLIFPCGSQLLAASLALSPPHFPWPCLCLPDVPGWSSGSSWIASGSSGCACLIFQGCLLVVSSMFDAMHLQFFDLGRHNRCWCWCGAGVGVVKGWGNKQRASHSRSHVNKLMIKPIFFYSKIIRARLDVIPVLLHWTPLDSCAVCCYFIGLWHEYTGIPVDSSAGILSNDMGKYFHSSISLSFWVWPDSTGLWWSPARICGGG